MKKEGSRCLGGRNNGGEREIVKRRARELESSRAPQDLRENGLCLGCSFAVGAVLVSVVRFLLTVHLQLDRQSL
jgi:hypothetical protein